MLLLTNDKIVEKIINLSLKSLDYECKIIDDISNFEKCDIFIIDNMFQDIELDNIIDKIDYILYISNDKELNYTNSSLMARPFLPSEFIKNIKKCIENNTNIDKSIEKIIIDTNVIVDNNEHNTVKDKNIINDKSIISIDLLDKLDGTLDIKEIESLKNLLAKDHSGIDT
jgi:hypothetical protein